ncbi:MFS transporter [Saccharothrix longispora]|uniref:MFS transporter n=1 Tax=Saccharothrix longispora TaxID=33920 RepID=UPI0028FD6BC1|nr:MFS transporter [Saccharothrix longispora]MBY8850161.1 MFS transporter [Saccharothrix sp. MB29]MDU0288562.1 MFS transporter [Saccharothrix longispora]
MTASPGLDSQPASGGGASGNRWLVLVIVCLAYFVVALDATVVNVALPSIERELGMTPAALQWVVNAYALVFGGFLLLGGRLADLVGRKTVFIAGVVLFTVASALSGLATSAEVLTIGRGLQGLGGALIAPSALSILTTAFNDPSERTKALGVWSAIGAGGSAFGLLIGGLLTGLLSWHWIFFINVPFGVTALVLAMRAVSNSREELPHRSFDLAGALTVTGGLVLLVWTLSNAQAWGWTSPVVLGLLGLGVALLVAFAVIESRSKFPLMRLSVLRIRTLAVANATLIFLTSGIFTMFFFSALYLQGILGYGPIKGGLAFLPAAMGVMVGATVADALTRKIGHVVTGAGGLGLATVGMLLLSRITAQSTYAADLLPGLLCLSIGLGIAFVPITFLATSGVPEADSGLASGIYQTVQQIGGAIGLAVLAVLAANRTEEALGGPSPLPLPDAQVAGFNVAFVGGAVLLAVGAVVFAALLRKRHVAPLVAEAEAAKAVDGKPAEEKATEGKAADGEPAEQGTRTGESA